MFGKRFELSLIALALALLLAPPAPLLAQDAVPASETAQTQVPQPDAGGVNWKGVGFGTLSVLANVPYIPAKLVYAILGGIVGGGAWAVTAGNTQVANTVWRSALGGDYVVTPGMLEGKDPINFSGPTETAPDAAKAAGLPSTSTSQGPAMSLSVPAPSIPPAPQRIDQGAGPVSSADRGIE